MTVAITNQAMALPPRSAPPPLVVDLDGTLVKTDMLFESTVRMLRDNPWSISQLPGWLMRGKHILKAEIATRVSIDWALLPYHPELLAWLRAEHATGRRLVLATASHISIARGIADHLGLFDDVIATDAQTNMGGANKCRALVARYGEHGFDYVGNAMPDLAIWPAARQAILVNPEAGVEACARKAGNVARVFTEVKKPLRVTLRALRVHQWLKNLLVFVPLIAAHAWTSAALLQTALAFVAFSLCASAIYLINDAVDLESDRAHARKKTRPLAAGDMSLLTAALLVLLLLTGGFALASLVSLPFLLCLAAYVATTSLYSLWLKAFVLVDVLLLGGLYTLRVIAGAVAIKVVPSFWLMAFSMAIFASLAMIKRCAELVQLQSQGTIAVRGRDYRVADLPQLIGLGSAAGYGAVIILALYINNPEVAMHYHQPQWLWMLCPLLMYWSGRMWIQTGRGEMHDDPIVYSLRDRISRLVAGLCILMVFLAL